MTAIAGEVVEIVNAEPPIQTGTRAALVRVDLTVQPAISRFAVTDDCIGVHINVASTAVQADVILTQRMNP